MERDKSPLDVLYSLHSEVWGYRQLRQCQKSFVCNCAVRLWEKKEKGRKRNTKATLKKPDGGHAGETSATTNLGDDSKETKMSGSTSQLIPNSSGVESLVRDICSTTSIAEFELKLGGFRLYMVRNLAGKSEPPPPILSPPSVSVSTNKTVEAPKSNGTVSTPSSVITRPLSSSGRIESFLDKAADEGLVGFFMRSRTIKGKRAPPSCKEKQIVKEGQVLCYIEQLGCEIPIALLFLYAYVYMINQSGLSLILITVLQSDVSGEVIKILQEDGDAIGYGDALIAILPSFPGIKKLQ
ncbi:hypothetical protein Godav_022895 [Gossypium davidsonii]|uniref:Lipoyl-binding domain-containing protein n=1 Tax=Gossypium davidsonii TaxID=34287 RepID=A0A7J8SRB9_GOSDV|nr:hypothetical protein [Gossypium davidsonii]